MPTKRSKAKPRHGHITEADAAALIAGDGNALRRALGLKPWVFFISETAERASTASEIIAARGRIEAELRGEAA